MNLSTFVVAAVVVFIIAAIIINLIKNRKKSCGGNCSSCGASCQSKDVKKSSVKDNSGSCVKTTLEIEGMSCGMCEAHINDTIRRTFDIKSVKSSHKKNITEIVSENPLDEEELKAAVSGTGYSLVGIKSERIVK